jgi:hypothetical protein
MADATTLFREGDADDGRDATRRRARDGETRERVATDAVAEADAVAAADAIATVSGTRLGEVTSSERRGVLSALRRSEFAPVGADGRRARRFEIHVSPRSRRDSRQRRAFAIAKSDATRRAARVPRPSPCPRNASRRRSRSRPSSCDGQVRASRTSFTARFTVRLSLGAFVRSL